MAHTKIIAEASLVLSVDPLESIDLENLGSLCPNVLELALPVALPSMHGTRRKRFQPGCVRMPPDGDNIRMLHPMPGFVN
jgi:hypothetical protein